MDYYEVDEKRMLILMDGLNMIERLNAEKAAELNLYLYGVVNDPSILGAAKDTIMENLQEFWNEDGETTLREEDLALTEIGVSIQLSSDTIYTLFTHHGMEVKGIEFAYVSIDEKGEGVRDEHFLDDYLGRRRVTFGLLSHPVLAEESYHLKGYMAKYKSGQPLAVNKKIEREGPATLPAAEAPAEPPQAAPQPPPTGMPREGSVREIRDVVESFLDRRR